METVHAELLIGGMRLPRLDATIDGDPTSAGRWTGRFALDRTEAHSLQLGRPYWLQLEDGRGARVAVTRMEVPVGYLRLMVEFEGLSPLAASATAASP